MTFIFRTVFWLALAIVILPPKARLGGEDIADFRDVDLEMEIHNAALSAWSFAGQAATACQTNRELCKAGTDLLDTSINTAQQVLTEAQIEQAESDFPDAASAKRPPR